MKSALFALMLSLPLPAMAQTLSQEIASTGIGPTADRLAALPAPTDADRFATGGLRFLQAVEGALQLRWQVGLTKQMEVLPFLQLPIPENPAPAPFEPAMIRTLFTNVATGMDTARTALAPIGDGSDLAVEIALSDLWFDVNANSTRDAGEDAGAIIGPILLGWQWESRDPAQPLPVIRFDAADAAWLSAYTHVLSGLSNSILAYDPTAAISESLSTRAALQALSATTAAEGDFNAMIGDALDVVQVINRMLDQTPDAPKLLAARDHFLSAIADNRIFWARVAQETDNDREWLPNDGQQSALGLTLPPGTGATWLNVLADGEALLKGERLVPYWRVSGSAGVNIGRMFTEPRPINLIAWIQGAGALPYLERGTVVSSTNWRMFEALVAGDAGLMAVFLN